MVNYLLYQAQSAVSEMLTGTACLIFNEYKSFVEKGIPQLTIANQ